MKTKKIPQRRCLVCQEAKDKKELLRIVKSPEGLVSIDLTGRKPGRGAYLCKNAACCEKAAKTKALSRAFSMAVPDEIYDSIREVIANE